jgi:hypothetical protein
MEMINRIGAGLLLFTAVGDHPELRESEQLVEWLARVWGTNQDK